MSSKSRQREHTERPEIMVQQIDANGDKIQIIRTPIPGIEEIYAVKRGVVGQEMRSGAIIMYIANPRRKGDKAPFTKIIDIYGTFSTETLEEKPDWWTDEEQPKKSNLVGV